MGLLDEVNKISQQQNVVLSQRQQKAKIKQQKDFLNYLTQQCKNEILEHLNDYTKNEIIDYIITDSYLNKLNQYDYFSKTLIRQKYFELVDFLETKYKKQSNANFEQFQLKLVSFFQDCYKKEGARAYFKLNQCKPKILKILHQSHSYKAFNFYDIQNKKLFNEYRSRIKTKNNNFGNFLYPALLGTCIRRL